MAVYRITRHIGKGRMVQHVSAYALELLSGDVLRFVDDTLRRPLELPLNPAGRFPVTVELWQGEAVPLVAGSEWHYEDPNEARKRREALRARRAELETQRKTATALPPVAYVTP